MDPSSSKLLSWMRENQLRFLRLCWVDNAGALCAQAISVRRLEELVEEGLGVVPGVQAMSIGGSMVPAGEGLAAVGQVWLVPDPATARVLPWEASHGSVMGHFLDHDGKPWPFCPRRALANAVKRLGAAGLSLQAAFEHEFVLLRRGSETLERFEQSHYASAHGLDHAGPILDDIVEALERQQVGVRTMLKEAGSSQFELSTDHGSAMQAADRFVAVRETIGAIAARHDLIGTALPLVFEGEAGNGWHLHFSLWRGDENVTGRGDSLGPEIRAFAAGIYHHLPALLALTTPTPNSFRRIRPGSWSGAYQAWGVDNKEAPLRVPTERHGAPTNVELKASDATANPHLSLAGVIAAGLDGLARGLELPAPIERDPGSLTDEEREALGIQRLPTSLDEALDRFEEDRPLHEDLGPDLTAAYIAIKRDEHSTFATLDLPEEVQRLCEAY